MLFNIPGISSYSIYSDGGRLPQLSFPIYSSVSAVWSVADRAYFIPFAIPGQLTIKALWVYNGASAANDLDIGIYDYSGAKLISTGSTAQSGTNTLQVITVADTKLNAGRYYMAIAMNGTTGTVFRRTATSHIMGTIGGGFIQSTAFPLPATATFAVYSGSAGNDWYPAFGLTTRSVF